LFRSHENQNRKIILYYTIITYFKSCKQNLELIKINNKQSFFFTAKEIKENCIAGSEKNYL